MEGGQPVVIPNQEGGRTTPSVVGFAKSGEEVVPWCYSEGLMESVPTPYFTAEQYFQIDNMTDLPAEYYNGRIVYVGWTTLAHSRITTNLVVRGHGVLRDKQCVFLGTRIRVEVSKRCYTYPDATIFVDKPCIVNVPEEAVSNPTVVFEVTSPPSENLDRSRKAELYRGMPSVREYVVVAHDRAYVEHYVRMETNRWLLTELRGLDQTLALNSVECEIRFAELYDDVEFDLD